MERTPTVRLQVLAWRLKANELVQCLIQSLAVDFFFSLDILAAIKDYTVVNEGALFQVKFYFLQLLNGTRFSNTGDVEKHFQFRLLNRSSRYWII